MRRVSRHQPARRLIPLISTNNTAIRGPYVGTSRRFTNKPLIFFEINPVSTSYRSDPALLSILCRGQSTGDKAAACAMPRGPRQTGSKEAGERRVSRVTHLARPRRKKDTAASEENMK
jgi:hypothetical protein